MLPRMFTHGPERSKITKYLPNLYFIRHMSYPDPDEVICGEISSAVKLISHSFLPIAVIYVLACLVVTSIEEEEEEEEVQKWQKCRSAYKVEHGLGAARLRVTLRRRG
jgi:hypothetical protein